MARTRHTPEQFVNSLCQADVELSSGRTVGQACKINGVTVQTYCRWRKVFGGMKTNKAKRLKELDREPAEPTRGPRRHKFSGLVKVYRGLVSTPVPAAEPFVSSGSAVGASARRRHVCPPRDAGRLARAATPGAPCGQRRGLCGNSGPTPRRLPSPSPCASACAR
ncbi:MAG: transposase [Phycisphaerales bacterium]|nr:transposase [Phycisphaerales bacterium]